MFPILSLITLVASQFATSWSYEEQGNNWTGTCATGTAQSPIDIVNSSVTTYEEDDDDDYKSAKLNLKDVTDQFIINSSSVLILNGIDFGTLEVADLTYTLNNAHIHAPSEHFINGKQYDIEAHIVGATASGNFIEAAVLFEEGDENVFLKKVIDSITTQQTFNLEDVFGSGDIKDYYYYIGSFTAPYCAENVAWLIYGEIQEASAEQILYFNNLWKNNQSFAQGNGNNKAIKPINGRIIYHYEESSLTVVLGAILLLVLQ